MDIFCKIVEKQEPSFIIFEDEDILAFLDTEPFSDGHTIIAPKKHFDGIHDIPEDILCKITSAAKKISNSISQSFHYDGIIILHNSGKISDIPHFHLHVYGKNIGMNSSQDYKKDSLEKIATLLK